MPLVLMWHVDQLRPLVDLLIPWLPEGLTVQMQLAIASEARSIVVDHVISGRGVHYARAKDSYRTPKRYRDGDPLFSWYYVTRAMDILRRSGLIDHTEGIWCPGTKGCQSVARPTDELVRLLEPLIDLSEPRGLPKRVETIVLRDRDDKADIDYVETADTELMRDQLRVINDKLAQLELRQRGQYVGNPTVRRIFNGSFDRGGRLYCKGNSYQNMPAAQRREIAFIVGATAYPAVEIDYSSLHIQMAYAEAGKRPPRGDLYIIDGFDRALVKLAVNTLFNAPTRKSAVGAIAEDLYNDRGLSRDECYTQAKKVVSAIRRKHHRIKSYFGSDCGARFQRQDSDMAVRVLTKMIKRTGRCPLPMHDSFLVPEIDAQTLSQTMTEVARDYGLQLDLKDSRDHHPNLVPSPSSYSFPYLPSPSSLPPTSSFLLSTPSLPSPFESPILLLPFSPSSHFTMEVTTPELCRWRRRVWCNRAAFMAYKAITDTPSTAVGAFVPRKRPQCHGPPALSTLNGAYAARIAVQIS